MCKTYYDIFSKVFMYFKKTIGIHQFLYQLSDVIGLIRDVDGEAVVVHLAANVDAARACGWRAMLYRGPESLSRALEGWG